MDRREALETYQPWAAASARNTDPHTSHVAAQEVEEKGQARLQRKIVMRAMERFASDVPRTAGEIAP